MQTNSLLTVLQPFCVWSKLERWKSSVSGCLMSWFQILKNCHLKCHLLFNATTNHISIRLRHVTKSGLYRVTSDDWLSGWTKEVPKRFPKPNSHQRKVIVTVWWSAARLVHYSFLNPSKSITSEKYAQQIEEIHWKLQCLQLALANRTGPILHHDT